MMTHKQDLKSGLRKNLLPGVLATLLFFSAQTHATTITLVGENVIGFGAGNAAGLIQGPVSAAFTLNAHPVATDTKMGLKAIGQR
jgi:hypothetical protein